MIALFLRFKRLDATVYRRASGTATHMNGGRPMTGRFASTAAEPATSPATAITAHCNRGRPASPGTQTREIDASTPAARRHPPTSRILPTVAGPVARRHRSPVRPVRPAALPRLTPGPTRKTRRCSAQRYRCIFPTTRKSSNNAACRKELVRR